jgi:1-acyl-sn-glycerol-3-phosphate acyltransferase
MKKLWLHSIKVYIQLGLFFYFKKIKVYHIENIPKDKPVLLLSNHQNALLDALLIAVKCGRFTYFLSRASVFKKSIISAILNSLQMLPVYRVRDGWGTITNNTAIFETCSKLLHKNEAIVVFPEGNHNLNRTVRPLSKGFTRIVFNTLEKFPEIDLQLVPVGVNFRNAKQCPDSTSLFFGKPITARSFVSENRNTDVINLKEKIKTEVSKLTTHIPAENYNETLQKLDALHVDYLSPKDVNACIANNFEGCKQKPKSQLNGLKSFLKGLLILNLFLPYLIWKYVVQPKIKEPEFIATFRFVVAITLVPIYLLMLVFVLSVLFSLKLALLYIFGVLLLSLLAIKL